MNIVSTIIIITTCIFIFSGIILSTLLVLHSINNNNITYKQDHPLIRKKYAINGKTLRRQPIFAFTSVATGIISIILIILSLTSAIGIVATATIIAKRWPSIDDSQLPHYLLPDSHRDISWSTEELQVVDLINQQRQANGCTPVTLNVELGIAAQAHSQEIATNNNFTHTGGNGSSFAERARAAGYTFQSSGEILAAGQSTPADAVRAWMNSSGHRGNILTYANDDVGVGMYENANSTYRYYWTVVFGQR